jgi:hypothetical protein
MNGIAMFQIGDLVEVKTKVKSEDNRKLIGLVETVVDGKVGVRYLNIGDFGYNTARHSGITVYINPLDFLRKVDKINERGVNEG